MYLLKAIIIALGIGVLTFAVANLIKRRIEAKGEFARERVQTGVYCAVAGITLLLLGAIELIRGDELLALFISIGGVASSAYGYRILVHERHETGATKESTRAPPP